MKIIVVSPLEVLLPDEKRVIEEACGNNQKILLKNGRFSDVDQFVEFIREHQEDFVCLVLRGAVKKWYRESDLEQVPGLMFGVLRYVDLSINFERIFCGMEKGERAHKLQTPLFPTSESIFGNVAEEIDINQGKFIWKGPGLNRARFN